MSAGVASDPYSRIQIRIPGWLLVLALVLLVAWWGASRLPNGDEPALAMPARVTVLASTFENGLLTTTVLVESYSDFAPNSIGFTIVLDDRSELQASGREAGAGAWHGRSYIFAIDRRIPEGRSPAFLQLNGKNGGVLVSLPNESSR